MSGITPFFLTGANAKIVLNNQTVAFATNVSYRITVRHASPRVLGRYEVEAHEPLTYDVEGSLTVIRYSRGFKSLGGAPADTEQKGNGIGSYGSQTIGGLVGSAIGLPSADGQFDGRADEAFNPSRFFQSKMFNIEIRQKIPTESHNSTTARNLANTLTGGAANVLTGLVTGAAQGTTNTGDTEASIILLRDCRMEVLDFKLTKRGVAEQTFTFKARYADDDTYIARKSGVGQELS